MPKLAKQGFCKTIIPQGKMLACKGIFVPRFDGAGAWNAQGGKAAETCEVRLLQNHYTAKEKCLLARAFLRCGSMVQVRGTHKAAKPPGLAKQGLCKTIIAQKTLYNKKIIEIKGTLNFITKKTPKFFIKNCGNIQKKGL